jgi:hypothetical protein
MDLGKIGCGDEKWITGSGQYLMVDSATQVTLVKSQVTYRYDK